MRESLENLRFVGLLTLAIIIAAAARARGGECCDRCGCADTGCRQVCRLVCEEKKTEILCWGCKCEDFCVPGPSTPGCRNCTEVCGTCGDCGDGSEPVAQPKAFIWTKWVPGCAELFTKKKLMQKKVVQKTPSYKWVVEQVCPRCDCAGSPTAETASAAAVDAGLDLATHERPPAVQ